MRPGRLFAVAGLALACWAATGSAQQGYDLSVPWENVRLGAVICGPVVTVPGLKGNVVLVESWKMNNQDSVNSMTILNRLHNELGNFGLAVIGAHSGELKVEELKTKVASLGIKFTVTDGVFVKEGAVNIPHVFLFNHQGKCIFRGGPTDAERKAREAVGTALADLEEPSKSKQLAPVLDSLRRGQPPLAQVAKIVPLVKSTDKITAQEAKQLLDRITVAGSKKLEEAEKLKDTDPIDAFLLIENLPGDFKGTPLAAEASNLLTELRKDKGVAQELKARPALDAIRQQDNSLSKLAADRKVDIQDPAFQKQNSAALKNLSAAVQKMQKAYPAAKATQEAIRIAEKYGLRIAP